MASAHLYFNHVQLSFGRFHLFVKLPRPGDSEVRSSSQAATCYYQFNHSKVEAIPLSALPKDTNIELSGLSPRNLFLKSERQAGKL